VQYNALYNIRDARDASLVARLGVVASEAWRVPWGTVGAVWCGALVLCRACAVLDTAHTVAGLSAILYNTSDDHSHARRLVATHVHVANWHARPSLTSSSC